MKSSRNLFGRLDSRPLLTVGRWPLCAVAVVGGLLMIAPQAQADWQMSYRIDGACESAELGTVAWSNGGYYNPATGRNEGNPN